MSEEKQEYKIEVPLFKDEELEQIDKMLNNDLDNIISKISKQVLRDKELIFMQKIISKQEKVIDKMAGTLSRNLVGTIYESKDSVKEYFYGEVEDE